MTTDSITYKVWALLAPDQRRAALVLLGLMIVGMVLETLGVGIVIPSLALFTQGDIAGKYPVLNSFLHVSEGLSNNNLIVIGMLALFAVYLMKNLFLAFYNLRQNKFAFGLTSDLSQRMFSNYLRQPYTFHLQRNSAELIRNTTGEVDIFAWSVITPIMLILGESLILFGLSVLVIAFEPLGVLIVAGIVGIASLCFNRLVHPFNSRWGELRQYHSGLRLQHLQQGLGSIKDVRLLGRSADFLEQYRLHTESYARVGELQNTLLQLPRLWLEILAVGGLCALVMAMVLEGRALGTILPIMGLFAATALRIMPSVNRILGALQSLKYSLPVISTLYTELVTLHVEPLPTLNMSIPFCRAIDFENVSFSYPSAKTTALCEVNICIPCGASVGFVGQSGAGKSTLVDILLGLLTPDRGTVRVDGINIQHNLRGWQDQIGYVPQSIFLTDDTLRRNVAFGLSNDQIDDKAIQRAICAAQLEQFVNDLPDGLDTVVGERGIRLSGGQRQRIGIARALYHDPAVLVLDEATSSLDTDTEYAVMEAVRALQATKTVIIVAHRLSTVEHCDRIYRLNNGRIIEDSETTTLLGED